MNDCKFVGNIGNAPELKSSTSGKEYAKFSIAVNKYWYNSENEKQEKTTWISVTVWGKLAAIVATFEKGTRVFVAGELSTNTVEKDGEKRTYTELTANIVHALVSRPKSDDQSGQDQQQ
jgi:single-strand DNA-binding protein